jgi:hypothetical protein
MRGRAPCALCAGAWWLYHAPGPLTSARAAAWAARPPTAPTPRRRPCAHEQFDGVLEGASQDSVYAAAAQDAVDAVLGGFNATIFCYGQVRGWGDRLAGWRHPPCGS